MIYKTERDKFEAAIDEIKELHKKGQPVLVGTISIEKSEDCQQHAEESRACKHEVLNAKHHEKEAEIVSKAGQNGRGDHCHQHGRPRHGHHAGRRRRANLGGLHILGTERHESRRIDNQLRGRSGRQGDPGSSRFYLSLEDDLLRIFGSERISGIMDKLGMEEGEPIEHSLVTKAIENAQKRVEGRNFEIRKHLLEYDDVMNQQREVIYEQRRQILNGDMREEMISFGEESPEDWWISSRTRKNIPRTGN